MFSWKSYIFNNNRCLHDRYSPFLNSHIRFSLFIHLIFIQNIYSIYSVLIYFSLKHILWIIQFLTISDYPILVYSTSLLHYILFKWIQFEESWIDYVHGLDWPEEKFWIFFLPAIRLTSLSLSQNERTSGIICDTLLRRGCKVFHLIITKCSYPIFFELLRRTKSRFPERNPWKVKRMIIIFKLKLFSTMFTHQQIHLLVGKSGGIGNRTALHTLTPISS